MKGSKTHVIWLSGALVLVLIVLASFFILGRSPVGHDLDAVMAFPHDNDPNSPIRSFRNFFLFHGKPAAIDSAIPGRRGPVREVDSDDGSRMLLKEITLPSGATIEYSEEHPRNDVDVTVGLYLPSSKLEDVEYWVRDLLHWR